MNVLFAYQVTGLDSDTLITYPDIIVSMRSSLACLGLYTVSVTNNVTGEVTSYTLPPAVLIRNMLNIVTYNGVLVGLDATGEVPQYPPDEVPTNGSLTYYAFNPHETFAEASAVPSIPLVQRTGYPWALNNGAINFDVEFNSSACGNTTAYSSLGRRLRGAFGPIRRQLLRNAQGQFQIVAEQDAGRATRNVVQNFPYQLVQPLADSQLGVSQSRALFPVTPTPTSTSAASVKRTNCTWNMVLQSPTLDLLKDILGGVVPSKSVIPKNGTDPDLENADDNPDEYYTLLTHLQRDIAEQTRAQLDDFARILNGALQKRGRGGHEELFCERSRAKTHPRPNTSSSCSG